MLPLINSRITIITSSSSSVLDFDSDISASLVELSDEVCSGVRSTTPSYVSYVPLIFFSISLMVSCS